jgi:hypothetical protein
MFGPRRADGGDGGAERGLRIAFANVAAPGLAEVIARLRAATAPALVSQAASA